MVVDSIHRSWQWQLVFFLFLTAAPQLLWIPANALSTSTTTFVTVSDLSVNKVPLRRADELSPFCYAVSSISNLKPHQNFLATQVWPAARAASFFLQQHLMQQEQNPDDDGLVVCELACGPGLPSLTAAALGAKRVIATDLETLALDLVDAAARDQNLTAIVETARVDLCGGNDALPIADLYILSDAFESNAIAAGAARLLHARIEQQGCCRVWVFCQSDRAQRETFREEMSERCGKDFRWEDVNFYDPKNRLCLFNVEEGQVSYG